MNEQERAALRAHIKHATKTVGEWPPWKQNILKHSSEPTNKFPREQVVNQPIDTDKIRADLPFMQGVSALRVIVRRLCDELDSRRNIIAHTQEQRNAELLELRKVQAELAELRAENERLKTIVENDQQANAERLDHSDQMRFENEQLKAKLMLIEATARGYQSNGDSLCGDVLNNVARDILNIIEEPNG